MKNKTSVTVEVRPKETERIDGKQAVVRHEIVKKLDLTHIKLG